MPPKAYYPIFADLEGRACLVVGGGRIAQRKATALLGYGAAVTVVSPSVTRRLAGYARAGRIRHIGRTFRPGDLRGVWLAVASTDDERVNRLVSRSAQARRVFTNVVDQAPLCSFIAPAIYRKGPLTIAVSTGGASPSVAKKLRTELSRTIGDAYAPLLGLLARLRGIAKRRLPSYADRKRYFDRLVHGRVFELVRAGRGAQARREALRLLDRAAGKPGAA
jgi:uroporphyrin-III C-methyltransferase/precorrin-2 dehydrogenase/sirohydrochlorin ferrochelatase